MPHQAAPSIEELKRGVRSDKKTPQALTYSKVRVKPGLEAARNSQTRRAVNLRCARNRTNAALLSRNPARMRRKPLPKSKPFAGSSALLACEKHASKALQARLEKDGFDSQIAQAAIERALRCGLISDERFADVLVRSRLSQGRGLQGIAAELVTLDIDPYSVTAYLEATEGQTGPDELARALAFLDDETTPREATSRLRLPQAHAKRLRRIRVGFGGSYLVRRARNRQFVTSRILIAASTIRITMALPLAPCQPVSPGETGFLVSGLFEMFTNLYA